MAAKGEKITAGQKEKVGYREIDGLNYSSIKVFEEDPIKFYKEFILKDKEDDDDESYSKTLGTLADDIILECGGDLSLFEQNFHKKYAHVDYNIPTTQPFILADILFKVTKKYIIDDIFTCDFETRFKEAFEIIQKMEKYKGKTVAYALEDFKSSAKHGVSAESYYSHKIDNIKKQVIDPSMKEKAIKLASEALSDENISDLLSISENTVVKDVIEFDYICLSGGTIRGKVEIDLYKIDNEKMVITPYDLKTIFNSSQFGYNYIRYKYYLQAGWYTQALRIKYPDYVIKPFNFIVLDTSFQRRPMVVEMSENDIINALNGFSFNGKFRRGIIELVNDIEWGMSTGIWNTSKQLFNNKGKTKLEDILNA